MRKCILKSIGKSGHKEAQAKAGNVVRSKEPATRGEKRAYLVPLEMRGGPVGAITSLHVVREPPPRSDTPRTGESALNAEKGLYPSLAKKDLASL